MVGRFLSQLHEQRGFLEASATSYDDGNESEAKRLAVNVRVLVYDHRRSVSLLTHLGVKNQLGYVDTALGVPPPGGLILHAGLCTCSVTVGAPGAQHELRYEPVLSNLSQDREHPPTSFVDWWETPLVTDLDGNEYTRGSIVLSVTNQDGGAHVDAQLNTAYESLLARNSLGLGASDEIEYENSVALGTVRQVAHELRRSTDYSRTQQHHREFASVSQSASSASEHRQPSAATTPAHAGAVAKPSGVSWSADRAGS
jgi:hypothetical protein